MNCRRRSQTRQMVGKSKVWKCGVPAIVLVLLVAGCSPRRDEVVVYTALDRMFSEPILDRFEVESGIRVRARYDTEATKTVGLVNAIRAERARPRCDVFWNNEIVNTLRLQAEGLLVPCRPATAGVYPAMYRDPAGHWYGFAARARVLIVNTNLVPDKTEPDSIRDLADPRWKGKTGIAKPLFGTTASHAACLFAALGETKARAFFESLRQNAVSIESGNRTVAMKVAAGALAFGLTDTDDAIAEYEAGRPVRIVYPDNTEEGWGVLFIPNTLAQVRNAPHPDAARRLIEYLLSPAVETALAECASAQIPLNPAVPGSARVMGPAEVKSMTVDFAEASKEFDAVAQFISERFLQ